MCYDKGTKKNKSAIFKEGVGMKWKDFNGDGKIDATERFLWDELMCTSKEEHEALFGDAGDFDEDDEEEDDIDFDDCDMDDDF